jgi:SAM-dependent methyltransferase
MFKEESIWIKKALRKIRFKGETTWYQRILNKHISNQWPTVLDLGSGTLKYRKLQQPFIEKNVFSPLIKKGFKIIHADSKNDEGVDLVLDIAKDKIKQSFDLVLCNSLLEHVKNRDEVARNIINAVKPGGYLLVSVPYVFPYHKDPIDTMYRPTNKELEKLFPNQEIIDSLILSCSKGKISIVLARKPLSLTQLANKYESDKGDSYMDSHNYSSIYDKYFQKIRYEKINILEIGLCRKDGRKQNDCPSLKMWHNYFLKANIFGFDIADFSFFKQERTKIFQGDQGDRGDLLKLAKEVGPEFDIIIDDGSHASHHQQISLAVLFEFLKPGGLYIIEDLHWQPPEIESMANTIKTLDFLKSFVKNRAMKSPIITPRETKYLNENISKCRIYGEKLAIIIKN